jgi:hypothetical protein
LSSDLKGFLAKNKNFFIIFSVKTAQRGRRRAAQKKKGELSPPFVFSDYLAFFRYNLALFVASLVDTKVSPISSVVLAISPTQVVLLAFNSS